ncbi:anti-sigma factor family protein [Nocardioides okcheonensis]|uniref:anti-sigma factor family protein n=1 Tax=Nocardioides okcheonensis TaxID=2894081 RepID=UPI001E4BB199|nr:zf-HC2 domain-containing protein [Nocardioides okcheonensis]UFN44488.1 zf-HC2 domain-containing protein [Nocardioides okcheonensis]
MTTPSGACPHAHDDAAYVLGALSPTERLAFERHLPTCEACSTSVRSLAGMPGLLDLADARVLADPVPDPPLPPALLASLTRTVVARRRRRATVVAALAGAAAAALALAVPAALDLADRPPSARWAATPGPRHPRSRARWSRRATCP